MIRRYFTIGIIFLFISSGISVATYNYDTGFMKCGDTLYVGGSGSGNYTTIQSAITASNDGDTVYVYCGTYNETIVINRAITLMGEDRNTTIIDGNKQDTVVKILRDDVTVKGFTIKESRESGNNWQYNVITAIGRYNVIITDNICQIGWQDIYQHPTAAIYLEDSNHCIISENIISNIERIGDTAGIAIYDNASDNIIKNNEIAFHVWGIFSLYYKNVDHTQILNNSINNNLFGIEHGGSYSEIYGNHIYDNDFVGLLCWYGKANTITYNTIRNNGFGDDIDAGIYLWDSPNNLITKNKISNNNPVGLTSLTSDSNHISENHLEENTIIGLYLKSSYNTQISSNNFIGNENSAVFEYSYPILRRLTMPNIWDGNYWSDSLLPGTFPKLIKGQAMITIFIQVPWFNIDWNPSTETLP